MSKLIQDHHTQHTQNPVANTNQSVESFRCNVTIDTIGFIIWVVVEGKLNLGGYVV